MRNERLKLDELLAKGYLGGPEYDHILRNALARTEAPTARRGWTLFSLAAVLSLIVGTWISFHPKPLALASKGDLSAGSGALMIGCAHANTRACRIGDDLMFGVNAAVATGFLGAYAERLGNPEMPRIWYFPSSTGLTPHVDKGTGTVVLTDGIRIGAEHVPGRYRVTAWLSNQPPDRRTVEGSGKPPVGALETFELEVLDGSPDGEANPTSYPMH